MVKIGVHLWKLSQN